MAIVKIIVLCYLADASRYEAPSSRGLGRLPLTEQTRVQIPMGSPGNRLFFQAIF